MTPEQCERSLAFFKRNSAPGLDIISSLPLKTSKSIISRPLSNIINSSSLYPPSSVPGSAAQSGLFTRVAAGPVSPTTN